MKRLRSLLLAALVGFMAVMQGCADDPPPAVTKGAAETVSESPGAVEKDSAVSRIAVSRIKEVEDSGARQTSAPETVLPVPGSSQANQPPPEISSTALPEGVSPALAQDAQMYADQFGVELSEAITRLTLQEPIGKLGAEIESNEPETFAGLWIQHEPEYRVVVAFTRDGESTIAKYAHDEQLREIIELRTADATLRELQRAQPEASKLVGSLGFSMASGINVMENRVELYAQDRAAALENALRENGKALPEHVVIIGQ